VFEPSEDSTYLMPIHFGGVPFNAEARAVQRSTSLAIFYETDKALLERFLPARCTLLAPHLEVTFSRFTEITWLAGARRRSLYENLSLLGVRPCVTQRPQ
jgi:acetoacetate decarboxylase